MLNIVAYLINTIIHLINLFGKEAPGENFSRRGAKGFHTEARKEVSCNGACKGFFSKGVRKGSRQPLKICVHLRDLREKLKSIKLT